MIESILSYCKNEDSYSSTPYIILFSHSVSAIPSRLLHFAILKTIILPNKN